jgi:probable rRNA maturation factor
VGTHRIGGWRIVISRRADVPRVVAETVLARAIGSALEAAGAPRPAAISLTLTDDAELTELNETHMGTSGPTDVLSFPLMEPDAFPPHPGKRRSAGHGAPFVSPPGRALELGDIVVSVARAIDQASEGRGGQTGDVRWSPADELRLLVTHGTLHITGWDHADPVEEAAMRELEQRLLAPG